MSVQLELPEYWIARPEFTLTMDEAKSFEKVQGDIGTFSLPIAGITLPSNIQKWHFLNWLVRRGGVLLHGSVNPDIALFSPRTPNDHSADEFSKQTAVYATTDSIRSIYYATLDRSHGQRHLNACLQFQSGESWSDLYYFFSLIGRRMPPTRGGQGTSTCFRQLALFSSPVTRYRTGRFLTHTSQIRSQSRHSQGFEWNHPTSLSWTGFANITTKRSFRLRSKNP